MTAAAGHRIALTPRDHAILRSAWSFGYAPASALRALTHAGASERTFRYRLAQLVRARYLTSQRFIAPSGSMWLYGIGRSALRPGDPLPWRPGLAQVEHTLAVAAAVVALQRSGFAAPLQVTSWQGEAEIRSWAAPGAPFPDARLTWSSPAGRGCWLLEVDRGTESRAAWRRKLGRYLLAGVGDLLFALTTSPTRAANIAALAADLGAPLLATTTAAIHAELDPVVYDARFRSRPRLSRCR